MIFRLPTLAELLAYGRSAGDEADMQDNVLLTLRGPDGQIKQQEAVHNLIVNTGRNAIVERCDSSPGTTQPTHMAIGTGATAPAAGDTALQTELDRNSLTSNIAATNVLTMVGDWAAGDGTGAITEAGVLNAASGGTLYSRATFSVINKGASDTLQITWTYTLTVS
jgi:hypothetical protein